MSNNPFKEFDTKSASYRDFVYSEVEFIATGGSKKVNLGGKTEMDFRATLSYVSSGSDRSFKTKRDKNGELWVLRTK